MRLNGFVFFLFVTACLPTLAQQVVFEAHHELVYTDDGTLEGYPEGGSTYRIYLTHDGNFKPPMVVFGSAEAMLGMGGQSSDIWNHHMGWMTGMEVIPLLFPAFPSLEYDSYLDFQYTSEGADESELWMAISPNPFNYHVQQTFEQSSASAPFYTPDLISCEAEIAGGASAPISESLGQQILLAQITVVGDVWYRLNVTYGIEGTPGDPQRESWNPAAAGEFEGVATLLNTTLIYPPLGECNQPDACNYSMDAASSSGCEYPGCKDPLADNFDPFSLCQDEASCVYATACHCDINEDGSVDTEDLLLVMSAVGSEVPGPWDVNSDGVVSTQDVLQYFGVGC